ncbi:MAG: hypothetical protein JXR96_05390 [Deltaproteobacteria bacterium]|nr:hypothetical protein [Deltaproteobacteria bacterium]
MDSSLLFVVAVTRWAGSGPESSCLQALAPVLGLSAYDLRLKLAGPVPVVLHIRLDEERCRQVLDLLDAHGCKGLALGADELVGSSALLHARDFELGSESLIARDGERERSLDWTEILALVKATLSTEQESSKTIKQRKSVVRIRKQRRLLTDSTEEREQAVYVVPSDFAQTVVLREHRLRYAGLGERAGMTKTENFTALVAELRLRAGSALFDERLLSAKRIGSPGAVLGRRESSSSNISDTDLAVHFLVAAHTRGAL